VCRFLKRLGESQLSSEKPEFRISIEVIDPIGLANRESKLARIATGIAPNFVTKEVYKQVRKEIILIMKERGVDANVTICVQ